MRNFAIIFSKTVRTGCDRITCTEGREVIRCEKIRAKYGIRCSLSLVYETVEFGNLSSILEHG